MKFCKYCGSPLEDGATCTCEKARAAAAQQQYVQPNPQPQQYNAQPQQPSPYAVAPAAPAGNNPFVKALKNVPVIFTSFWKNSKAVIETAKNGKDVIVAGVYTGIFFVAMLLFNMFTMISLHGLHFGKTLLAALIMTVLACGFYSLILFAYNKKYNSAVPASKAFTDAFITFSIESIPVSIVLIVGGLFALIGAYFSAAVVSVIQIYLIISLVANIRELDNHSVKNPAVYNVIQVLAIFAAVLIFSVLSALLLVWSFNTDSFAAYSISSLFNLY